VSQAPTDVEKVAVVTGAASGFGAALARRFTEAGMRVVVLDRDEHGAETEAAALRGLGQEAVGWAADVTDGDSLARSAAATREAYGRCDVLCANAGVLQVGALDRLTDDDWRWALDVNLLGVVRTVRAFLPLLRETPGDRHVVITASVSGLVTNPRLGAYAASKAAVMSYGETLRLELAPERIGVTLLLPAAMATGIVENSAAARPSDLSGWLALDEDWQVMAETDPHESELLSADAATEHLLAQILADEPYAITHGKTRLAWAERTTALSAAFERMERARGTRP